MKILMLVSRLNVGGTETYILSVAKQLRKLKVGVGVATRGGPLVSLFRRNGIPVHLIPHPKRGNRHAWVRSLIRRHGYNVTHAHDSTSFRWMTSWPKHESKPGFLITLHGKYLKRNALLPAARRAQAVIACSPGMHAWAKRRGVSAAKIVPVPNGIDTAHFRPAARRRKWKAKLGAGSRGPVIVYAGRFQPPKHLVAKKLIQAAGRIAGAYPNGMILLTGPGSRFSSLRKMASRVNARLKRKYVSVRPALSDVRYLYWAGDLAVGTGRVALEALACGKPVLAVGVSGYVGPVTRRNMKLSIRTHFGDHGSLSAATPRRLANGILHLLAHSERLPGFALFGRETVVRRFSIVTVANRLLELYRRSVHTRNR